MSCQGIQNEYQANPNGGSSGGTDVNAFHKTTTNEIEGLSTAVLTLQPNDVLLVEEAGSLPTSYAKRKFTWTSFKSFLEGLFCALTGNQTIAGIKTFTSFLITPSLAPTTDYQVANKKYVDDNIGTDSNAIHDNVAGEIAALTNKATPEDTDVMVIEDSSSTPTPNEKKKSTLSALKAFFKTYFDTLYSSGGSTWTGWNATRAEIYSIGGVNQGTKTFTLGTPGDWTALFLPGQLIQVEGSTGNDKSYTIVSRAYSNPNFTIVVAETIDNATADGTITNNGILTSASAGDDKPVGTAVRYKATAGTYRYGIVTSVSGRLHFISGHPCTASDDDVFEYDASHSKVHSETIHLAGNFNAADSDVFLSAFDLMGAGWYPSIADEYYLVGLRTFCQDDDSSANPDVNIVIFGGTNKVFSADVIVDNAVTYTANTAVVTYYALNFNSALNISIDKVGTGDAYDADITFIFVKA